MGDYQVVCFGKLIPGCGDKATVQKKVAALFKVQEAQIAPFFTGQRVVVKSGLAPEKAKQYQQALAKAGVEVQIESLSNTSPQQPQQRVQTSGQSPKPKPAAQVVSQQTPAAPAASSPVSAAAPSTSKNTQVAPALKVNDDYAVALTVQVDGQKLGDLQQASVAPAGSEFEAPPPVQAPSLDLSHLSVADPGSGPLEPEKQEQAKPIDISHLSLG